jgi:hypothetical protein
VAIALLALAPSAGAATVRSVTAPAPVLALAHDGSFVAYASGRSARDCNRVHVWNLASRGVTRLARRTHCVETSTGNAIARVSVAGRRVLWLHYAGGNRRNYTLWTATTTRPAPRLLASREVDVDDPAPIVLGDGTSSRLGDALPYASGRSVVVIRADGARRFAWDAPARVVALDAAAGQVAVATEDRAVTVLDAAGRVLRVERYAEPVLDVRLTGGGVVVQRGSRIELRDGSGTREWRAPGILRLEDATSRHALYAVGSGVRAQQLAPPYANRPLANVRHARLEGSRLVTAAGRAVTVRPFG